MSRVSKKCQITRLAWAIACCILTSSHNARAEENLEFDRTFLMGTSANGIDLDRYTNGNATLPGTYDVGVSVNNKTAGNMQLTFIDVGDKRSARACITPSMLMRLHIRQPEYKGNEGILQKRSSDIENCLDLDKLIPQSSIEYNANDQLLNISVPQAWEEKSYSNYIDPAFWEDGVNAAMFSYNMNAWHNEYADDSDDSFYSGLNAGINLGGWHLRSQGNYSWRNDEGGSFDLQHSYVQHDIPALRSQFAVGEQGTSGNTFDSVSVRGVRLYSETLMLPPVLASYSPSVHGVARSNAKVTITQNNYKIYETTVPPGPFELTDFTPGGYGADLVVTIEEADGSKRTFTQPYSSLVQMMHPGVGSWDISLGEIQQDDLVEAPMLAQGTFYYGFNNTFTGYTGFQVTDNDYYAGLLGVGMNTVLGAFSLDVTHSQTTIPNIKTYSGQSYRISWNKFFAPTNTSLNIAAYRYTTKNYLSLTDAMDLIDSAKHMTHDEYQNMNSYSRLKDQVNLSMNQSLRDDKNDYGSFYLTGTWSRYWVTNNSQSSFSFGYSNSFKWASYSIGIQRSYDEEGEEDDAIYLTLNVPLDKLFGKESGSGGFNSLSSSVNSDLKGNDQYNTTVNGNSKDNRWNYSVNAGYNRVNGDQNLSTVGTYASYESPWGTYSGSASASNDQSRQYSLSTDGGFVLHRGGLTFSGDGFNENDTLLVVNAPGAQGARIGYGSNTVDRFGYGVFSSLTPYRENTVSLDISELDNDVEMKSTSTTVVPRQGAVIFSTFETDQRRSAIVNLTRSDGQPLPFAASIFDTNGTSLGAVGQGGQAFVRGVEDEGDIVVRWSVKNQPQSCKAHYQLPQTGADQGQPLIVNTAVCKME
ncbi:outer membrane usher protein [Kluyvera georgiana]|uniref:outer membrane usher protein n=1 Tax=Kluyvera georgiana TaxID=73098 RepID=UPI00322054A0